MSIVPLIIVAGLMPGQLPPAKPHTFTGARSLALSSDGKNLAFTYRGDIWVVPSEGGRAIALTSNVEMDDYPIWSPDGKWIAFATDRNGNWDIYAVPVEGGQTVRLTYSSGTEIPSSWNGSIITMAGAYEKGVQGIYTLDVENLRLGEVFITNFRLADPVLSPDGKKIAFTHKAMFGWERSRYQGSGAAQLWTINAAGTDRKLVRNTGFQHLWPQFSPDGEKIYTVTVSEKTPSSRNINEKPKLNTDNENRTPNVYEVTANGSARRLTNFVGGSGTRFLTVAKQAGNVAFENEGTVYTMTPGGQPKAVAISGSVDPKGLELDRQTITGGVVSADLSPDGKTVAFDVRRELFSVPTTRGKGPNGADAKQLTDYAGTDTSPLYSPDGKTLFFISDRDGANSIYTMDVATGQIKSFYQAPNEVQSLTLTPDQKHIAFWENGRQGGYKSIPIEGGTPKTYIDKPYGTATAFSPDMKYIAYGKPLINSGFKPWENSQNIWVKEIATGNEVNVTKLNTNESDPAWSADGKYLYFFSDRGPIGIYGIPAQAEDARTTELELKYEKPEGTPTVNFDFTNPDRRIRLLIPNGAGPIISDKSNGDIIHRQGGEIFKANYDGDGVAQISRGGIQSGYKFNSDGSQLFTIQNGAPTLINLRRPGYPAQGVEFRADWTRDVNAERKAAFHEFWRIYNNQFYDEFFHRRDWAAIRDRYEPLLDSVAHRREMADVLNMMVGELEASHAEVSPSGGGNRSESTATIGVTYDYSHQGLGVRVKEVPQNTPGSFPKTQIKPGEYIMKVNGQTVRLDQNFLRLLNNEGGRDLTLHVNDKPTMDGAREVKFRAMSSGQLRGIINENRIEWRRKYVEELSGGKVTYVHIAGMGGGNLRTFNNEMWEYVQGKEGVIIDVRENGGGNIADILIDILERRLHMRYVPRDGDEIPGPGQLWAKPTVVMHAETSFSNAEMFPATMKTLGLAKLVGMPTPGYVIYTYGGVLVDGTPIRLPSTGVYRVDGTPLENMGEEPDFKVDIDPDQYFRNEDPQLKRAVEEALRQIAAQG